MRTRHAITMMTGLAAVSLAACPQAFAQADEEAAALAELATPASTVEFGLGYLDNEGRRFGQYTGMNEDGFYGLLDFSLVRRDDASGTWLKFTGTNVGLDHRAARFEHTRQGDWGYFVEFSQIPRYEPYVVNTRLLGIGTGTQTVNGLAAPQNFDLKTRRDAVTLGFDRAFSRTLGVQVRFRNEEKDGSRLFGQGTSPGNPNVIFLADPINYTTRQLEVTLNHTTETLQLSGGYYGTDFENSITALNVVGAVGGLTPMALPPGNQSHQLFLSGGYRITPTTRGTFRAAYTHQTQTEAFVTPSAATGRTDLGGRVDTSLFQLGVTSRPLPRLSLLANLRHENRSDKTPIAQYIGATPTATFDGSNEPRSIRSTAGKLEASYGLPMGFRVTGGLDYDERKRNTYRVRSVSHRDRTEEITYRAELRRSMSETVTGAISYAHSDRDGSPFLTNVLNNDTPGANLVHPLHLADRKRDRVRLTATWQVAEPLSLQFYVDQSEDRYSGRSLGPRKGEARTYSLDASYALSYDWSATAWISRNDTRAEQSICASASAAGVCPATPANPFWDADMRNIGDAVGAGLRGNPQTWLKLGADIMHSRDKSEYRLSSPTPGATVAPLPDAYFNVTRLNLFANYAIRENSGIRLSYVFERWSTDDWTWTAWTYSDGTRVLQDPVQKVHFVGVSYYYRWR
jgi:MtrB/PioB family decaheme-associated outer membrane protein